MQGIQSKLYEGMAPVARGFTKRSKNLSFWKVGVFLPVGIYLLKVNNRNTRTSCEICSKLTIKKPERQFHSNLALAFLLLTLNM